MKKYVLALAFFIVTSTTAQSIDVIKNLIGKNEWKAAKDSIDAHLKIPKNAAKADGWYYKGMVYAEYSKKEQLSKNCPTCKWDAFEAFKKCLQLDEKNIMMVLEQHVRLFDLYNSFFDLASTKYQNKDYENAYHNFKNAHAIQQYIYQKGFTYNDFKFSSLDTSLVLNIGIAARLANKQAEAVAAYEQLINANLQGEANLEMYQYVAQYYLQTKNDNALNKILAKGRYYYPTNGYWIEVELSRVDATNKPQLFAAYEKIIKENPTIKTVQYNYCVELFNYLYTETVKPKDYEEKQKVLENNLEQAKGNAAPSLSLLVLTARHYYNRAYEITEQVKVTTGTTIEITEKRKALKTQAQTYVNATIVNAEQAVGLFEKETSLTALNKANYKTVLGILEAMYEYKNNKEKAAFYKIKQESLK